jgi:glyoxylase-like metal-dependent hydrolase (beta-lactamase superfamily II)
LDHKKAKVEKEKRERFHRIDLGITKCYLLKCKDGYLLIDTAYTRKYNNFKLKLLKLNIKLDQIKYLLLTHHHDDHVGFASKFLDETNAQLIVHTNATQGLLSGKNDVGLEPVNGCIAIILKLFGLTQRHIFPPVDVTKYQTHLITGDENGLLDHLCGIEGKIIHTPGHTQDSISVIMDSGEAFVGDAAMNFLNFCRIKYRPIFINDMRKVLESWDKIIRKNVHIIYPAHGQPFTVQELVKYKNYWIKKYGL